MKKWARYLVLVVFFSSFVFAANIFPSSQDKYVNDFVGIFDSNQIFELSGLLTDVEQQTTAEYVVVTVDKCAPYSPDQYAIGLLNEWKVGKADKNNGLVAVYCAAEGKIFVATGYGLEGILPDSKIGRFLDENYVLLRDSGNVSQGIIQFSRVVAEEMIANKDEIISGQAGASSASSNSDFETLIFIIIFFIIINAIRSALSGGFKKRKPGFGGWILPLFIPIKTGGASGFSSGGFGGGFSGGFGGGGGGGGGAGR
jgi:uncharacterized protein